MATFVLKRPLPLPSGDKARPAEAHPWPSGETRPRKAASHRRASPDTTGDGHLVAQSSRTTHRATTGANSRAVFKTPRRQGKKFSKYVFLSILPLSATSDPRMCVERSVFVLAGSGPLQNTVATMKALLQVGCDGRLAVTSKDELF